MGFSLGVIPLIRALTTTRHQVHQVWYADGASSDDASESVVGCSVLCWSRLWLPPQCLKN